MKIENKLPPNFDQIVNSGMRPNRDATVFTYGDVIYNPSCRDIPPDLIKHEEKHSKQQGDNPSVWWDRYIKEPYFRIDQETEAYAAQYDHVCGNVKDRNYRNGFLLQLADILSSPLYGSLIKKADATKMIKNKAKTK